MLILICSCSKNKTDNEKGALTVKALKVKKEIIKENIYSIGTISYIEKINITSKVMGKVNKVYVDVGSRIQKGSTLLKIDDFPLQLELKKTEAELESTKSALVLVQEKYKNALKGVEQQLKIIDKAQADLNDKKVSLENIKRITERKKQLLDVGGITLEEYETLQTELTTYETKYKLAQKELEIQMNGYKDQDIRNNGYKVPKDPQKRIKILKEINTSIDRAEVNVQKAKVKNAQAQVDSIKLLLKKSTIRSPINGIVAVRNIETGERIVNEEPLLVVMNIDNVYALLNVSESKIKKIKKGNKIKVQVDALGEENFTGYIHLISPIVDLKTRTIEIKGKIRNAKHSLKPGMFARAYIYTGKKRETITLPGSCVLTSQSNTGHIFTLHNKNEAYSKEIQFKELADDKIEVIKGIKENDIIILNHLEKLEEGDIVNAEY